MIINQKSPHFYSKLLTLYERPEARAIKPRGQLRGFLPNDMLKHKTYLVKVSTKAGAEAVKIRKICLRGLCITPNPRFII